MIPVSLKHLEEIRGVYDSGLVSGRPWCVYSRYTVGAHLSAGGLTPVRPGRWPASTAAETFYFSVKAESRVRRGGTHIAACPPLASFPAVQPPPSVTAVESTGPPGRACAP